MPGGAPCDRSCGAPTEPVACSPLRGTERRRQPFQFIVVCEKRLQVVPQVRMCRQNLVPVGFPVTLDAST